MRGFISRPRLAALLDRKTATLGGWDHDGKGIPGKGPIYLNPRSVIYRIEDAEKFVASLGLPPSFIAPQERGARRSAATPSPRERGARTLSRPDERSGVTEAPITLTPDGCGHESAPTVAAETEEP